MTGAARGIGFATASLLAQHGARVVLVDLNEDSLKAACATIGHGATYRVCDVSDWDQQVALFDRVTKTIGAIYLLVLQCCDKPRDRDPANCPAGKQAQMASQVKFNYLADDPDTHHETETQLQRPSTELFDVNINSVVYGLKLGIYHMKSHSGGRIVVVGSAASYVPVPSQPLYTAGKHAVLGLVRSTAQIREVVEEGISISWVAPWLTLAPMVEGLQAATHPDTLKSSPEDVAQAIIVAATADEGNGKGYWIQGEGVSEVERAYDELAGRLIAPENRF